MPRNNSPLFLTIEENSFAITLSDGNKCGLFLAPPKRLPTQKNVQTSILIEETNSESNSLKKIKEDYDISFDFKDYFNYINKVNQACKADGTATDMEDGYHSNELCLEKNNRNLGSKISSKINQSYQGRRHQSTYNFSTLESRKDLENFESTNICKRKLLTYENLMDYCNQDYKRVSKEDSWKDAHISKLFVPDKDAMASRNRSWGQYIVDLKDYIWNTNYDAMILYCEEKGHCNIPRTLECKMPDGTIVKLGLWLSNQRARKKISKMRPDRLERMQQLVDEGKLDWYLDRREVNTDNERWDFMFTALLEYGKVHGHCNVPQSHFVTSPEDSKPIRLGEWLSRQRTAKRNNNLIPERRDRLQALEAQKKFNWEMSFTMNPQDAGGMGRGIRDSECSPMEEESVDEVEIEDRMELEESTSISSTSS